MRYFLIFIGCRYENISSHGHFFLREDHFPSVGYCEELAMQKNMLADSVFITGITELTEKDYNNLN